MIAAIDLLEKLQHPSVLPKATLPVAAASRKELPSRCSGSIRHRLHVVEAGAGEASGILQWDFRDGGVHRGALPFRSFQIALKAGDDGRGASCSFSSILSVEGALKFVLA